MIDLSKKQTELRRFEQFKTAISNFPEGCVEPFEEPDFLVHTSGGVLGIELTELHRQPPSGQPPDQEKQAIRERIVKRAQAIYEKENHPPVFAAIHLNGGVRIHKKKVESLAQAIVKIVRRNYPAHNVHREEYNDWEDNNEFPELVQSVSTYRLDSTDKTFFSCPGSCWIPFLSEGDVQRVLNSKENRYSTYRKKCSEVWLLISIDTGVTSTWFTMTQDVLTAAFNSSFDRVFLMQHGQNLLAELHIGHKKSPAALTLRGFEIID